MAPVDFKRRAWRALCNPMLIVLVGLVLIGCRSLMPFGAPTEVVQVVDALEQLRTDLSNEVLKVAQVTGAPGLTPAEMNAAIAEFAKQAGVALAAAKADVSTPPPPGEQSSTEDWLVWLLGLYLAGDKAYQMHKAKRAKSASTHGVLEAPRAAQ